MACRGAVASVCFRPPQAVAPVLLKKQLLIMKKTLCMFAFLVAALLPGMLLAQDLSSIETVPCPSHLAHVAGSEAWSTWD